jgi:hypothetical protein
MASTLFSLPKRLDRIASIVNILCQNWFARSEVSGNLLQNLKFDSLKSEWKQKAFLNILLRIRINGYYFSGTVNNYLYYNKLILSETYVHVPRSAVSRVQTCNLVKAKQDYRLYPIDYKMVESTKTLLVAKKCWVVKD